MLRPPPRPPLFPYTTLFRSTRATAVRPVGPARSAHIGRRGLPALCTDGVGGDGVPSEDRKSTRLNSSHRCISYAVFCLKKKKLEKTTPSETDCRVTERLNRS